MTEERKTQDALDIEDARKKAAAETTTAERARLTELKAAFPDDLAYAVSQFEAGASLQEAKAAYSDVLAEALQESEAERAAMKAAAEKAASDTAGGKSPDGTTPVGAGDPPDAGGDTGDFLARARARSQEKKIPMSQAVKELAHEDPAAHEAWIEKQKPVRLERARR